MLGSMERHLCLLPFLFLCFTIIPEASASLCHNTSFSWSFSSEALFPLDTDGLVGRYAGAWNNATGMSFQLWLLSFDRSSYFLSLVAMYNAREAWELLKPIVLWSATHNSSYFVGENASLAFEADGGLQLRDGNGRLAWSSGMSPAGGHGTNFTWFCIGNLADILIGRDINHVVWRASDRPSNTLTIQKAFRPGNHLVSWTSNTDPTQGPYTLQMETEGLALKYRTETYWTFVFPPDVSKSSSASFSVFCWQENGMITLDLHTEYSHLVDPANNFLSPENCTKRPPSNQTQLLVTDAANWNYATFVRLEANGDLVLYTWNTTQGDWYKAYNFSSHANCFLPSQCGPYGVCNKATGECIERCPSAEGRHCNITISSDCPVESEFRTVPGLDYFSINYTNPQEVGSEQECMEACRSNCSCKAAFFKPNKCFQIHEDVQTLQTGEFTAFLKMSKFQPMAKELEEGDHDQGRFLGISLGVLVPSLALLFLCLAWTWWNSRRMLLEVSSDEDEDMELSLREIMPKRFKYRELERITLGFSDCLGIGGYGSVYKGRLPEGTEVAVKKLLGSNQTTRDFYAEIASLARTNHLNLVKFLGFCAEGPRKRLLVYEFMANGSLDKWIFEEGRLSWEQKCQIAAGTAQGLCYLHEECAERIIHLDLKPENVLLDGFFVPKIADFGLSKLMNREVTYLQMTSMRGTPGYLAPEYLQVGTITEKSDVFSFGVLLLEIITGCRNKSLSSEYLRASSTLTLSEGARLRTIAYMCIQDDPELRPSMSNVVKMMEGLVKLPRAPSDSEVHFFLGYRSKVALSNPKPSIPMTRTESNSATPSTLFMNPQSFGPR